MAGTDSTGGRPARLAGIEGVRGIAAASIVVYHVWLYGSADATVGLDFGAATKLFSNLRAGVTLFFVLSGFLLFRPYAASILRAGPHPSVRRYLRNRAFRILPAYWVILLAVAVLFEHELLRAPAQFAANALFVQNYVPDYVIGAGIVPAWSLSIEVTFYLALPALGGLGLWLAGSRPNAGRVRAALAPVALLALVGIASKLAEPLLPAGAAREVWEYTILTHGDWFAGGMTLAIVHVLWEDGRLRLPAGWRTGAVATAGVLSLAAVWLNQQGILSALADQTPIAIAASLLLGVVVCSPERSLLVRVLDSRAFYATGLASYSLFLWHDPLVRFLRVHDLTFAGTGGFLPNLLIVGVLSGAASVLTYRYVERPALRHKRVWQLGGGERHAARESSAAAHAPTIARVAGR